MAESERIKEGLTARYSAGFVDKMRENPWIIATCVLGVLLVVVLFVNGFGGMTGGVVSSNTASTNLLNFIKSQGQGEATLVSAAKEGALYKITVNYKSQDIPVYVTTDGKYLITNPIALTGSATAPAQAPPAAEVPKTAKPKVELFVMSFCPYGLKAENNILPVVKLLGSAIDFKVRYIVQVSGNTMNDVQSLHGINEAKENARQLIIARDYSSKFYDYLSQFNSKCGALSQDAAGLDVCWKGIATGLGIDSAKVETAAYGADGIGLLKIEEAAANSYGVSGSPTLVINGVQSESIYGGTEPAQTAICGAFTKAPSTCGTAATAPADAGNAPSGSCG